jgi:tRNA pseudouridine synthase 10
VRELAVDQKTPVRVLHRRSLAVRRKVIHSMRVVKVINDHYLHLNLTTQAGTYIKEFVHGDFGRTKPNLGSILGCEADILQLDVLEVLMP